LGNTAALAGGFIYTDVPKWCTVLEQSPNATVVTSAALRAAIVATGRPWRVQDKGTGIEMVLIPGGTFNMGCSPTDSNPGCGDGYPVHQVTLTAAFYMSRTEVTQSQWVTKMSSNPSYRQTEMNLPVECVSWNAAQTFCSLSGLRLATEAEWEYAYRAGTSTAFHDMPGYPNGTNSTSLLGTIAWYSNNSSNRTHPVAGKAANGFGLFDMSGNVWEWCQDWLGPYTSNAQINPTGPSTSTTYRVLRGGHYSDADCTASSRTHNYRPNDSSPLTGLRVARSP
jgi:formylglycine-generating enzyme required for sulfatase activity